MELKTKSSIGSLYLTKGLRLNSDNEMEFTTTDDHSIADGTGIAGNNIREVSQTNLTDRLSTVTVKFDEPSLLMSTEDSSEEHCATPVTVQVSAAVPIGTVSDIGDELSSSLLDVEKPSPSTRRNTRLTVKKRPPVKGSPPRGLSTVMEEDELTNSNGDRSTEDNGVLESTTRKRQTRSVAAPVAIRQTRSSATKSSLSPARVIITEINIAESPIMIGSKRRRTSNNM